jgi:hypothetical protein
MAAWGLAVRASPLPDSSTYRGDCQGSIHLQNYSVRLMH